MSTVSETLCEPEGGVCRNGVYSPPKGVTSEGSVPVLLSYDKKGSFELKGVGGTGRSCFFLPEVTVPVVVTLRIGFDGVSCVRCFGPGEGLSTVRSDAESFITNVDPDLVEPSLLSVSPASALLLLRKAFICIIPRGMTSSSFGLVHCVLPVPVW